MELHAFYREAAVAQAHDDAGAIFLEGVGGDFEVGGQVFFGDDEGMVAGGSHRGSYAPEYGSSIMLNLAGLSVHKVPGADHAPAEGSSNGLMSQANTEHGNFPCEVTDELDADASLLRGAGTGRDYDPLGTEAFDFLDRDLVVPPHLDLRAQFSQVLNQVVGKRIVVVEDEDHGEYFDTPGVPAFQRAPKPYRRRSDPAELRRLTVLAYHAMLTEFLEARPFMADAQQDKRSTRRFALHLPVSVTYTEDGEKQKAAETRDVSARGISFYVDAPIAMDSPIEFTLTLPPEITLTESIKVRCKGRVVRIDEKAPNGKMAVAAVIDEYEFLSQT